MRYHNIYDLFFDLIFENPEDILLADDPKALIFAWLNSKTDKIYEIGLTNLKTSIYRNNGLFPEKFTNIIYNMRTSSERKNILFILNEYPEIRKLRKLKAFL